ncbi:plasmid partitioning/stability family protein [Lelliottia sp. JS-SCA-14]|uniref:plasmid partitioning/stability family protein n=1 Tax=Lelliottia sp. JS-SCA-14 TaxID=3110110 RepID=UPI002D78169F|nr:plasmid partitioning/stability family protein [Lelliottia sp. JS-SCA-14]
MPAGKYSLYLYQDDCRDMQTRETIEGVSQPLRGEFLRATAISGAVLYRIDVRLPAALASLFVSPLLPGQLTGLLSLLSGNGAAAAGEGADVLYSWKAGKYSGSAERRRFNLILNDDESSTLLTQLLDDASSRQRGTLLRELVIAGCALHDLDSRFPRLLSSMPEPPATIDELSLLAGKLLGQAAPVKPPENIDAAAAPVVEPATGRDVLRQNMKKLL